MTHIELPRALEAYFAHAEIDPTRTGRRFTITLPYFEGNRLDRLQWWYHLRRDQEQRYGDAAIETLRAEAIERFSKHIERWLQNNGKRLHGTEPIPRIDAVVAAEPVGTPVIEAEQTAPTPLAATSNAA